MKMKRTITLLLAFMLVLGGLPAASLRPMLSLGARAAEVVKDGYIIDEEKKTYRITGAGGWAALDRECWPQRGGMVGWTVTLENDITLAGGLIPSVDDFKGSFDGKGHTIKIPAGTHRFSDNAMVGPDIGLFRNLMDTAKLQNLIVLLEGTLQASTSQQLEIMCYGVLVGKMSGSARMQNCALIGKGLASLKRELNKDCINSQIVSVGSMVGQMEDVTVLDGCYSDCRISNITSETSGSPIHPTNVMGGIVGYAGVGSIITNTAYLGTTMSSDNVVTMRDYNYAGGIVGHLGVVSNCYVYNTSISCCIGPYGRVRGHYGYVSTGCTPTNCYSNVSLSVAEDGSDINSVGQYHNISAIDASMMGSAWTDTAAGLPNLKWLVTAGPSAAVSLTESTLRMTPAYAEYNTTPGYQAGQDALWKFEYAIPLKGRSAPLTAQATLRKAVDGSMVIRDVTVSSNSSVDKAYLSGLTYPFLATITGRGVEGAITADQLKWTAIGHHENGSYVDTTRWWQPNGCLAIPESFYGTVDLTASYGGKTSPVHTIAVQRGSLSMASKTVQPGSRVPMDLTLQASAAVLDQLSLGNVRWALKDDAQTGMTLDEAGVLTVPAQAKSGRATVTATIAGMKPATATITVADAAAAEAVTIDLTKTAAQETETATKTIQAGQSVRLTVLPHVPQESGATSSFAWTGEDATQETTARYQYHSTAAGSFSFTAVQTVTHASAPSEAYTAQFTILVQDAASGTTGWTEAAKASPAPIEPTCIKGQNDDSGGGDSTTTYSLALPAATGGLSYYYKLCSSAEVATELTKTFLSTQALTDGLYQLYGTDIPLPVAEHAFLFSQLLVVAVDSDIGHKLPSVVTQYALPTKLPDTASTPLSCQNPGAAGALPPTTGKLTAFYSDTLTAQGAPSESLPLDQILKAITNVPMPPQSVDYIATGDLKLTVWPTTDRFGGVADKSRFVKASSDSATKGDIAPKPTVYPRANGIITGGVTLQVPTGGTVLYTATPNVITPVIPQVEMATGKPKEGSTTKTYQAGESIPFPDAATSFVVCAVTWIHGKSLSDFDYVIYKNDANLLTPVTPDLLLNGIKYSSAATYPGDSGLSFTHADMLNGEILFTVNGDPPTAGLYNTKTYLPSGGDGIGSFDPKTPYKLSGSSEVIVVKAKFHNKKTLLDSPIATYLIAVKQKLSAPAASVPTDSMIRPGTSLELSLSDEALTQLNANSKVVVERTTYRKGITDAPDQFPNGATLHVTGDVPKDGTDYVSYYPDSNAQGYTLPSIRYLMGDDTSKLASDGMLCRYGQRRVLTISKTTTGADGVSKTTTEVTVTYTNPQPIALTGAAGQQLKVNAMAISGVEAHSDSLVATFRYTVRSTVAAPTAFPATDPNKPVAINIGDRIALSTETADTQIFYTVDGSEPKALYTPGAGTRAGEWTPQGTTKLYDETQSIVMASNAQLLFTVRTFAVSKDFSLESSPSVMFRYQPPAQVQAVFTSPSQGAVVANQPVSLKCTTADAKIFYKIFTDKKPDIETEQGKKENLPKPYLDQIFDSTVPIVITKPTWIVAIAEKNGVLSEPTLNTYTVAAALEEPYASLRTGSVVYKGTRIRLNGSGNLAFTIDGSDPKAVLTAQQAPAASTGGSGGITINTGKDDTKKAEVFYGDSVVIDADYGKSITVRAFAYGEGRSPSNTVSFTYTVCEKDKYLTAAPGPESVVTSGDSITLTTGISGGLVFYSTGSATPTLTNRYDEDGSWDESDDYTHYRWTASSNTRKGNSVRVTGEPGGTFTVKATVAINGAEGGTSMVFTYPIRGKSSAPTASIPSGAIVFDGANVTLSAQEGAIFYTTDGTEPSTSSRLYNAPIAVTGSMVLKAIAVGKDKVKSDAVEYLYSYADQVFAPGMSTPGGEIDQGSRITLTSQTEGATIYYSTNGVDPTKESTLYTSPITVMRPVTIKAIALKKGLRDSAVNSASYTVIEPELPPAEEESGGMKPQTVFDGLVSRRTYFDATAGPRFHDVVLSDAATNAVLSADTGVVSKSAKLIVKQISTSDSDQDAVQNALGQQIVTLYDVSLEQDGERVQPQGTVEIGIPIPTAYQNGVVTICRVGTDNTVEEYQPRRSGNSAYITVEGKLDRYAVTIPAMSSRTTAGLSWGKLVVVGAVGVLLAGGIAALARYFYKKRRSNGDA